VALLAELEDADEEIRGLRDTFNMLTTQKAEREALKWQEEE